MDFASQDAELRAALFRFVDVVPACRSLDDLARHLTGFLDEVDDPPQPIGVAMRMGESKTGRAALGVAAATGVKRMARRFIVGETPRDAHGVLRGLWADGVASSVDLLGEATVTAQEADRYAERCASALTDLAAVYAPLPAARAARARRRRAHAAGQPVGQGLGAHAAAAARRPPARQGTTPRCACASCCAGPTTLGAHLHIDMESFDSREAITDLVLELLDEDEFRDRPVGRDRPSGVPARLAGVARAGRRLGQGIAAHAAADGPARQGRLLGSRGRRGPPARVERARVRGQGRLGPQLRDADPRAARGATGRAGRDRVAQPAVGRQRDRREHRARRRTG